MLLFLDYDGVLHPDDVFLRNDGRIELRANGHLFIWASLLGEITNDLDVQIVLSTSWVRNLGFRSARRALPEPLSARVVGATWHSAMAWNGPGHILWDSQTRYEQIQSYLDRLSSEPLWLAVDDDEAGWPEQKREHLIRTDSRVRLSDPAIARELRERLLKECNREMSNFCRAP